MLSRRHLRIKVFQALYALESARDANFRLAEDQINDNFKPDLNSMTPQDPLKLEGLAKIATIILNENVKNDDIPKDIDTPAESYVAAQNALKTYQNRYQDDVKRIGRRLVPEVEAINDSFLKVMKLISEIAAVAQQERERVYEDTEDPIARLSGLDSNVLVKALQENTDFASEVIRRNINWNNDTQIVRQGYKDVLRKNEEYRAYCAEKSHTLAQDQTLLLMFVREILFKHEFFVTYFEQNDLFWEENSGIVKKMISKTLQSVDVNGKLTLAPLTDAWDEDSFFMQELYQQTTSHSIEYEQVLKEPLKNWELERLALTDMLILKMGLAEMIHFAAIPVKVTMNECIELAKEYSTPKSGKFVNGILDVLSKKLTTAGTIRKSGRGLIGG